MVLCPCEPDRENPVRILLVDDNAANLLALEAVLEPLGQNLVCARSGSEALEKLSEGDWALVLMDIAMPILDGFQTVEKIRARERSRHLPVMFVTAIVRDREAMRRGYELGAVDFIAKPFEAEIIRAKVRAVVILHQYNERLQTQQRLLADEIAARKAAEQANRMKEEFIAILGHDLRTPLSTILLTAETHEWSATSHDPSPQAQTRIVSAARRMSRMIDDILDFTRGRLGGGIPIERVASNMVDLCRAPLEELQTTNPACTITFEADGDLRGEWDPERVLQVTANLVGNAVKHGDGAVRVVVRDAGDVVVFETHNGGDPIPAHKMGHLFEPFRPGEPGRDGLGLGLYIVDQIVRAHDGWIDVTSSREAGTTITVFWPRRARTALHVAPGAAAAPS